MADNPHKLSLLSRYHLISKHLRNLFLLIRVAEHWYTRRCAVKLSGACRQTVVNVHFNPWHFREAVREACFISMRQTRKRGKACRLRKRRHGAAFRSGLEARREVEGGLRHIRR